MNKQSQTVDRYRCSQLFGYKGNIQQLIEEDDLTTLKFDQTGRYLALGDKAGRLIAFQIDQQLLQQQEYQYYFEFQAQSPDFDTLNNYTLGEEVMYIDWLRPQGRYMKVLTANQHTVNLWKIHEKNQKKRGEKSSDDMLMQDQGPALSINVKKHYRNPSFSPLNSVQISHNEEYIFTADQSSVCIWNIQNNNKAFLQRELKDGTENKLEKSQKITCAFMSNYRQSLQLIGTNKGKLSVIDSRVSFNHPTVIDFKCMRHSKNFLSEIINQYSAVKFLQGEQKIATRDLISVKIWDTRNTRQPFLNVYIDQSIQNHVCELFEAEVLEDRFRLTEVKGSILSGNYGDTFQIIDPNTGENFQYQLDYGQQTRARLVGTGQRVNPFNFKAKVLAHDYNFQTGQIAVSTRNCFFIFSEQKHR